jgi:uncharacterized membrane protein AbrB (regulator of aidB expression)
VAIDLTTLVVAVDACSPVVVVAGALEFVTAARPDDGQQHSHNNKTKTSQCLLGVLLALRSLALARCPALALALAPSAALLSCAFAFVLVNILEQVSSEVCLVADSGSLC